MWCCLISQCHHSMTVHFEIYVCDACAEPCLLPSLPSFSGVDIALFSAGGSISKKLGPVAADAGCIVSTLHWPLVARQSSLGASRPIRRMRCWLSVCCAIC